VRDCTSTVTRFLEHGEALLWSGRPLPGAGSAYRNRMLTDVGLPLALVAIGVYVFHGHPNAELVLTAIIAGSAIVIVLIRNALNNANRCYALTDRRVLIVRVWPPRKFSLRLVDIASVSLVLDLNDVGSIKVATRQPGPYRVLRVLFERIEHARLVYDLLRVTKAEAEHSAQPV
jgi:hypothetical protein